MCPGSHRPRQDKECSRRDRKFICSPSKSLFLCHHPLPFFNLVLRLPQAPAVLLSMRRWVVSVCELRVSGITQHTIFCVWFLLLKCNLCKTRPCCRMGPWFIRFNCHAVFFYADTPKFTSHSAGRHLRYFQVLAVMKNVVMDILE